MPLPTPTQCVGVAKRGEVVLEPCTIGPPIKRAVSRAFSKPQQFFLQFPCGVIKSRKRNLSIVVLIHFAVLRHTVPIMHPHDP